MNVRRLLVEGRQGPLGGGKKSVEGLARLPDAVLGKIPHSEGAEIRHFARLFGALFRQIAHSFRHGAAQGHL